MPKTISGQSFHVVTCQSCENELSFQHRSSQDELRLTCTSCGHSASYPPTKIRQVRAEYAM